MLACDFPWNDDSIKGLSLKIQNTEPNWKVLKNKFVSEECIDILRKMLTKDKKMRVSLDIALDHVWFKSVNEKCKAMTQSEKNDAM